MKRLTILFPLVFLLSGCWDYSEPTMQEYVLGIGIDLDESGTYLLTIETADLTGSPESSNGSRLLQASGSNLFDAVRNAIPHSGKKLYWGHCDLIIISEAVTGQYLHEVFDVINRAQDIYLNNSILVARGVSAKDVLHSDYGGADSITSHCLNTFQNQSASRRFRSLKLWEYTRDISLRDCILLPTVTVTDKRPSIQGGAIYRGTDRLGFLSGDEVLLFSLLTEKANGGWLSQISLSPGHFASFEILSNRTVQREQQFLTSVTVSLSSANAFLEIQDARVREETEKILAEHLKYGFSGLITRATEEGFSSLLGFSENAAPSVSVTVHLDQSGIYHAHPEDTV